MPNLDIVAVRAAAKRFTLAEILDVLGKDKGGMGTGPMGEKREVREEETQDGETESWVDGSERSDEDAEYGST